MVQRYLRFLGITYFAFCFLQRLFYATWIYKLSGALPERLVLALVKGIPFDFVAGFFLFLPTALFLLLLPKFLFEKRGVKNFLLCISTFSFILILFSSVSEVFFFEEFQSRFNFIAVDYLVYTHEVIRNIWESYPMVWVSLGLVAALSPLIWILRTKILALTGDGWGWKPRLSFAFILGILTLLYFGTTEDRLIKEEGYWTKEVSKNSVYTLFSAYWRNSIDYKDFYAALPPEVANRLTHEWLEGEGEAHVEEREDKNEDEQSVIRNVLSNEKQKNWNVIFVVMESLSARFMSHYGNTQGLTPNLDRLADEGIFFSNLYATGTRTVRGLEALMLSLPPTPGQSILRRPNSDGIFNIGTVFSESSYRPQFLYGGYGYFDNMKGWFESNGFEVLDRSTFPENEIEFTNAWGVCDEDLFKQVIKNTDRLHAKKEKFFQVVLNTSNHRPYTYPSGRIDIPSHTGREGAVKYSDYAIGEFIREAKTKPWFKNTLFVFVADHNASVAGGVDIPIHDYLIPAIFYAPGLIQPQKINQLSSQIDLPPTLLGLMGFSYQSRFFGQNIFKAKSQRALMGTYQKIAWMEPGKMVVLAPGRTVEEFQLDDQYKVLSKKLSKAGDLVTADDPVKLTVSIYQSASAFFTEGGVKTEKKYSKTMNRRAF